MTAIRDAQCAEGAQRIVLDALALRANPAKGWTCWPSYRLLANDTLLNEETVRRAAKALEEKNLIRRKLRMNTTNIFTVRFKTIVRLAEEKARIKREQEEEEEAAKTTDDPIDLHELEDEEGDAIEDEVSRYEPGDDHDNNPNTDRLAGWRQS